MGGKDIACLFLNKDGGRNSYFERPQHDRHSPFLGGSGTEHNGSCKPRGLDSWNTPPVPYDCGNARIRHESLLRAVHTPGMGLGMLEVSRTWTTDIVDLRHRASLAGFTGIPALSNFSQLVAPRGCLAPCEIAERAVDDKPGSVQALEKSIPTGIGLCGSAS